MNKHTFSFMVLLCLICVSPLSGMNSVLKKRTNSPFEQSQQELLLAFQETLGITLNTQPAINYEELLNFIQKLPQTDDRAIQALLLLEQLLEQDQEQDLKRLVLDLVLDDGNGPAHPFDL